MAEDLQKRLHFGDPALCLGAVAKIYGRLVAQKKKIAQDACIDSQSPQIQELRILWEQCSAASDGVSAACSEALVSLVRHGHADFSYVVNGLLNVVPSAANAGGPLRALRLLLLLETSACRTGEGLYRCPYGLRFSPHPLISALNSRPDCWPLVLQQVCKALATDDNRYRQCVVPMLRPLLTFVLLNPTPAPQQAPFKTLLMDALLRVGRAPEPALAGAGTSVSADICQFLLDCLCRVKITCHQELTEAISLVASLSAAILADTTAGPNPLRSLSTAALTLCRDCLTFGLDLTPCLAILARMVTTKGLEVLDRNLVCLLSWLMLETPVYQLKDLLTLTEKVVTAYGETTAGYDPALKMLIFPLLRVISVPVHASVTLETRERSANQRQASQLLAAVTRLVQVGRVGRTRKSPTVHEASPGTTLNGWHRMMETCSGLAARLDGSPAAAAAWLAGLRSVLQAGTAGERVSPATVLLLASLLWGQALPVVLTSLETLTAVARQDVSWAPSLLPLLLHRLAEESDPQVTFDLLRAVPQTASHKVCAASVLRTLQLLAAGDAALAPLVVRLTTQLWTLQDRSFPHLQKLLLHPGKVAPDCDEETLELLLAKVASIRDVCLQRPNRGAELLAPLSMLLEDCTAPRHASIAALALDALHALCQAEVVDLRTMWSVLAPKLAADPRPLVIQSVCKLLGAAPALLEDTANYEEFCDEVVELMWQHSNHGNPAVSAAAFTALANFSEEDFTLEDIPAELSKEERAKVEAARAKQKESGDKTGQAEDEVEEEEECQPVPPSCYMKLLMHAHPEALPAYQEFLSSLLVEEIRNLPRTAYKPSLRRQQQHGTSSRRAYDGIPSQLLNRYERTKQPGLKLGLSVGLLFCFEPKKEGSQRADKQAKRHVVSKGRAYQHMINTLMNEVGIEPANWFGCLQLPQAWATLMQNAFQALIQSRCAELELQQSHGHLSEGPADVQARMDSAWLWVRDKLTDQLKTAAKSTPLAQANSVLALASLAVASTQHFLRLAESGEAEPGSHRQPSQHAGQQYWLGVVIETMLCLLDDGYRPKAKIFTWYHQHQKGSSASSAVVRGNAALALSLLAPFLLTSDPQRLNLTLDLLARALSAQPRVGQLAVDVRASCGVGLGLLIAKLFADRYTDYTGTEGEVRMMRVVDALEEAAISDNNSAPYGPLLGLAAALSAMSTEGATHIKTHLAGIHRRLLAQLDKDDPITPYTEALCMCIGCLTAASFHSNIIGPGDAFTVAVKLQMLCQQHDQNPGLALSTGVLFHGLVSGTHPTVDSLLANLYSSWSSAITDQTTPIAQRMAAMYGLTGLVSGAGPLLSAATESQATADMQGRAAAVSKHLTQMLSDWSDPSLQNASAFLLGYLHLASASASQGKTGIPSTYSYLPETSLLRACIDQAALAGRTGPETLASGRLEALLAALTGQRGTLPPLPPLNWAALLSPIMRLPYGEEVHRLCLVLVLSQSQRQSSAALFLTAWLGPALFGTLKESGKAVLYGALATLIRAVPVNKLKPFLELHLMDPFRVCGAHTLDQCATIAQGLLAALGVPDPPQGTVLLLHKAVSDVYKLIPASFQAAHGRILALLAQCLCHLPGEGIDAITSPMAKNNLLKSTYVRAYIVSQGRQSLLWLNPCIDVAMNLADSGQHQQLVWMLLVALVQIDRCDGGQHSAARARLDWLVELMGHTSNVARAKTKLDANRPIHKAVQFLLDVFSAAVLAWSPSDLPLLLAAAPSWSVDRERLSSAAAGLGCSEAQQQTAGDLLRLLPYSLPLFLDREPWSPLTDKMLEWLLSLHELESEQVAAESRVHLKAAIVSLRHTAAFKRPSCWTRVYNS